MQASKLFSTLTFISQKSFETYKYEIFQGINDGEYFAIISAQQDIDTIKYGTKSVWIEIETLRLSARNAPACEDECKFHFKSIHA
ncbi:hypothetical protein Xsto_03304 [Xenorhabdus stockiae]|uniref:Uncharacterized protein n=1 Tax=Xenorhabdus stockiae TaxID=351614 RepID=A0A2D0KLK4_9GAMM|nr:hypothetical protein [Xenorhabdus stockiae]PHM64107.1 hypothetical protein Xsto_03304 [Xenorhabdus stockiae]